MGQGKLSPPYWLTIFLALSFCWCQWEDHRLGCSSRNSSVWDSRACQTYSGWGKSVLCQVFMLLHLLLEWAFSPIHLISSLPSFLLIVLILLCWCKSSFFFLINTLLGIFPHISAGWCLVQCINFIGLSQTYWEKLSCYKQS